MPEQIGKICPVVDDLTINAPVLRKVLLESTNPYVMAEARGDSNNATEMRLTVSAKKQISRFIGNLLMIDEASCGTGREEDSTSAYWPSQVARPKALR